MTSMDDTSDPSAPTVRGASSGVDAGIRWSFEAPEEHWREHDRRQVAYWRSRPPEERLAQAAYYRWRVHGDVAEPEAWSWRFVDRH